MVSPLRTGSSRPYGLYYEVYRLMTIGIVREVVTILVLKAVLAMLMTIPEVVGLDPWVVVRLRVRWVVVSVLRLMVLCSVRPGPGRAATVIPPCTSAWLLVGCG